MSNINYYFDRDNFKKYGVFVSKSDGLLSKPKTKQPVLLSWKDYHGDVIDLSKKYYESRDISLDCFIKASSKFQFIQQFNLFSSIFDRSGLIRLSVTIDEIDPLVYEVYLGSEIEVKKTWSDTTMVGTFTLKLKEPEPIKKLIRHKRTSESDKTVSITLTSQKLVNVYWGDGSHTFDVSGTNHTITHDYDRNGTFYIIVTGNIDEITALTTTGKIVWNKF